MTSVACELSLGRSPLLGRRETSLGVSHRSDSTPPTRHEPPESGPRRRPSRSRTPRVVASRLRTPARSESVFSIGGEPRPRAALPRVRRRYPAGAAPAARIHRIAGHPAPTTAKGTHTGMSDHFDLDDANILVTGGTGSFGKRFIATVLERYEPRRIVIFSRDELKQFEMQNSRTVLGSSQDAAVLHRRRSRRAAPAARHGRRRRRRSRGGAQAGAGRRVQPLRGRQDQHPRRRERHQRVARQRRSSTSSRSAPTRPRPRSTSTGPRSSPPTSCSSPPTTSAASTTIRFSVVRYGNVMGSRGS